MDEVLTSKNFYTADNRSPGLWILIIMVIVVVIITIYIILKLASNYNKPCSAPPSIPVNVRAGYINDSTFSVFWNYSSDADKYTVYVGQTPDFQTTQSVKIVTTTKSRVEITQLPFNSTYYIRVSGSNSCGESSTSATITFVFTA